MFGIRISRIVPGIALLACFTIKAQQRFPCLQESPYANAWSYAGPISPADKEGNQQFGAIASLAVNPHDSNELYIGAYSSGLFRSTNRGRSWECLTDSWPYPVLGVNDIQIDFNTSPRRILLATGSSNTWYDAANFGALWSDDGGLTWNMGKVVGAETFTTDEFRSLIPAGEANAWFALSRKDVYRSDDGGRTWEKIFSPELGKNIFAGAAYEWIAGLFDSAGQRLYLSTRSNPERLPGGSEWKSESKFICLQWNRQSNTLGEARDLTPLLKRAYDPGNDNPTYAIRISAAQQGSLIADRTFTETREHALYWFDLGSETITRVSRPNRSYLPEDIYWRKGLIAHPQNPAILYLCGDVLYRSADTGETFIAQYPYGFGENHQPHADIRSALFFRASPDGQSDELYLGTDGGLSFSANSGATFRNLSGTVLPITQFYGLGVSPFSGMVSAGAQDNSIISWNPQTGQWRYAVRGDGYDVEYSRTLPGEAFGQYNARTVMRTVHDSVPFDEPGFLPAMESASNRRTLQCHPNGNTYFASFDFHVLRPGEKKWSKTPIGSPHQALAFAVSEADSSVVFLSSYWNRLYRSLDGGRTFADISEKVKVNGIPLAETRIQSICLSPSDPNKVWISLGYLGNYQNPCTPGFRVLFSADRGETWVNYSEGLSAYYISDLCYLNGSDDALFAASFDGVFYKPSAAEPWALFSKGFPQCIVSELKISYCRGTLLASTYGRGLWETKLPEFMRIPQKITGKRHFGGRNEAEAEAVFTDLLLSRSAKLFIDGPVHMGKGCRILVHHPDQVILGPNGRLLNRCGEPWGGIVQRAKR